MTTPLAPTFFALRHDKTRVAARFDAESPDSAAPADWPALRLRSERPGDGTFSGTLLAPEGTGDTPVAAGWALRLPDWSRDHYVLAPAVVYAGNRFRVFPLKYPPYWPSEQFEKNPPVTITDVPCLNADGSPGLVQLLAGALALPAIAVWSPVRREAIYLVVDNPFPEPAPATGAPLEPLFEIEEGPDAAWGELRVSLPGVRATRYVHMSTGNESPDRSRPLAPGDSLHLTVRVIVEPADSVAACIAGFSRLRHAFAEATPPVRPTVPFAEAYRLIQDRFNRDWLENPGLYAFNTHAHSPFIFSTGWPGVPPFPLAQSADALTVERARRNLSVLLAHGLSPSGFLYGKCERDGAWSADHGSNPADAQLKDRLLARRNGDALYYLLKLRDYLAQTGRATAAELAAWDRGLRTIADAFVKLWEREGQFGYLVHQETGEILVGGSTSAACAPAALALASRLFNEPRYLAVAEAAARVFARDYLEKGYTVGAPGEALWCPDSESAASLVETYATLHDLTGSPEWLRLGRLAADLCATWTIAYDYPFPKWSEFGRLGLQSKGGVFANSQNGHGAPGICTHAGLGLLRLFRASGESRHLHLLRDIARTLPQYISRPDRPIHAKNGKAQEPGWINERLNTSDWDNNLGGIFHSTCWCEVSMLYSVVELPGIYAATDSDLLVVLDHIEAERRPDGRLRLHNPTAYAADVRLLAESATERARPLPLNPGAHYRRVALVPGETRVVSLTHA